MKGGMRRFRLALAVAAVLAAACAPPPPPVLGTVPDFSFTERDGNTVTRGDLEGRPWVADFIFTRCVAYCPRLTARMKELRRRLPADVRSVSFSVDPDHDTPAVLTAYAREWQVEGRDWLFLTAPRPIMWELIRKGFLLPVEETPDVPGAPILHSSRFVLVDGKGRIRGTYEAFEEGALDRLVADLGALDREPPAP